MFDQCFEIDNSDIPDTSDTSGTPVVECCIIFSLLSLILPSFFFIKFLIKKQQVHYDAGVTFCGDPVQVEWYGDVSEIWGRLEQIGWENAREHNIEAVIRQQIQIDILSREQRRLVRVVVILQVLHGSIWRLFVPSSSTGSRMMKYVKQEHQRLKVLTTCPESVAAIYWLGAPWVIRSCVNNVVWYFPSRLRSVLQVFGNDYRAHLMNIVSSVSTFLLLLSRLHYVIFFPLV